MTLPSDVSARAAGHTFGERPLFLDSHRARGLCTRERSHLFAEVASRVEALHTSGGIEAAVVRASPERYIAQLGPVALTIAWLRDRFESVSEGELLAIVWRGTVARSAAPCPERIYAQPITTAKALWEETVLVEATSEETWRWCPRESNAAAFTSVELAERYVDRLRAAYADAYVTHQLAG